MFSFRHPTPGFLLQPCPPNAFAADAGRVPAPFLAALAGSIGYASSVQLCTGLLWRVVIRRLLARKLARLRRTAAAIVRPKMQIHQSLSASFLASPVFLDALFFLRSRASFSIADSSSTLGKSCKSLGSSLRTGSISANGASSGRKSVLDAGESTLAPSGTREKANEPDESG